jgi:[histone H3]-lysine36 N-dimethyltransferase SETMAR
VNQTINSEYYIALLERELHELGYKLLSHPPYSPDLAPSDFFQFAELKRMLARKKFSLFEAMSTSYFKNGIEKLYDRFNSYITLERNYIE